MYRNLAGYDDVTPEIFSISAYPGQSTIAIILEIFSIIQKGKKTDSNNCNKKI